MGVAVQKEWFENPDNGMLIPPHEIRKFLAWYTHPDRRPRTETIVSYARDNGLPPGRVRKWFKDPRFCAALEEKCQELNLRPDRVQAVVDAVWDRAVNKGDIRAAELYLRYVGRLLPPAQKVDVSVTHSVTKLSDEQLQAEVVRLHKALNPGSVIDVEEVRDPVQVAGPAEVDARQRTGNGQAVGGPHP